MANINDYVSTYAKDSMLSMEFNELDALVLTQLSYIKWDDIVPTQAESEKITLRDAILTISDDSFNSLSKDQQILLTNIANSNRYANIEMSNYVSENITRDQVTSPEEIKQFSAVTFSFKDASSDNIQNFVAFRGTDSTLEGWQEDFNMVYDMDTEAQLAAKDYLNSVGTKLDGDFRIGGHSKGGNDLFYAYLFCDESVRDKIVELYAYDAPGLLNEKALNNENYAKMLELLEGSSFAPFDSIIGLLMQETGYNFVATNEGIFLDHDPFSWEIDVENKSFIQKEQSDVSKLVNETLDELIYSLSEKDRKIVINALWEFLYTQDVENFDEVLELFGERKLEILIDIYTSDELTLEEKWVITKTIGIGLYLAVENDGLSLVKSAAEQWIEEKKNIIITAINKKLNEVKNKIKGFFIDLKEAVIYTAGYLKNWLEKAINPGYVYAKANSYINVDTAKLRNYADRLRNVNRRISALDRAMDSLYWQVGFLDLLDLIHADILTGHSWRIDRCINYLTNTAADFEAVERAIASKL